VRCHRKQGNFEVIASKSILAFRPEPEETPELSGRYFAFVQTYDEKPKRRLFELLQAHGLQPNEQVAFLSDGGEDVRGVQMYLHPEPEHLLVWFHVSESSRRFNPRPPRGGRHHLSASSAINLKTAVA
jgi:hypothetical protein